MVANYKEIEDVTRIILQWLPETYAYDMMNEIWDNCVQFSDNESLRATVQGLIAEIERQDHVKWEGVNELK